MNGDIRVRIIDAHDKGIEEPFFFSCFFLCDMRITLVSLVEFQYELATLLLKSQVNILQSNDGIMVSANLSIRTVCSN